MKMVSKIFLLAIGFTLAAGPALAAVETVNDVLRILNRVVDYMFTFLLIIAIIFMILAAYNYLFSAGDQEKVKKAHLMIVYTVVAIAVALLARSTEFIVKEIIGAPTPSTTPGLQRPYKQMQEVPQEF